MKVRPLSEKDVLTIQQVAVGELTAGQMGHIVREAVESRQIKVIIFDSLVGYYAALPDEPQLLARCTRCWSTWDSTTCCR
jgi:circadian clock protein KaiC